MISNGYVVTVTDRPFASRQTQSYCSKKLDETEEEDKEEEEEFNAFNIPN